MQCSALSCACEIARCLLWRAPGVLLRSSLFFFNLTATTEIYTLSLHDALPIYDPDQVIEILTCGERQSAKCFRLVGFAIADERPDLGLRTVHKAARS